MSSTANGIRPLATTELDEVSGGAVSIGEVQTTITTADSGGTVSPEVLQEMIRGAIERITGRSAQKSRT